MATLTSGHPSYVAPLEIWLTHDIRKLTLVKVNVIQTKVKL